MVHDHRFAAIDGVRDPSLSCSEGGCDVDAVTIEAQRPRGTLGAARARSAGGGPAVGVDEGCLVVTDDGALHLERAGLPDPYVVELRRQCVVVGVRVGTRVVDVGGTQAEREDHVLLGGVEDGIRALGAQFAVDEPALHTGLPLESVGVEVGGGIPGGLVDVAAVGLVVGPQRLGRPAVGREVDGVRVAGLLAQLNDVEFRGVVALTTVEPEGEAGAGERGARLGAHLEVAVLDGLRHVDATGLVDRGVHRLEAGVRQAVGGGAGRRERRIVEHGDVAEGLAGGLQCHDTTRAGDHVDGQCVLLPAAVVARDRLALLGVRGRAVPRDERHRTLRALGPRPCGERVLAGAQAGEGLLRAGAVLVEVGVPQTRLPGARGMGGDGVGVGVLEVQVNERRLPSLGDDVVAVGGVIALLQFQVPVLHDGRLMVPAPLATPSPLVGEAAEVAVHVGAAELGGVVVDQHPVRILGCGGRLGAGRVIGPRVLGGVPLRGRRRGGGSAAVVDAADHAQQIDIGRRAGVVQGDGVQSLRDVAAELLRHRRLPVGPRREIQQRGLRCAGALETDVPLLAGDVLELELLLAGGLDTDADAERAVAATDVAHRLAAGGARAVLDDGLAGEFVRGILCLEDHLL